MTVPTSTPGHGDRERELDRQLVARRLGTGDGRGEPRRDLLVPGRRRAVHDVTFLVDPRSFDEAVTLEPGQRRVDLPDVERPGGARASLELRPQLVAVHRPLLQQRQQRVPDRHPVPPVSGYRVCIPRMQRRATSLRLVRTTLVTCSGTQVLAVPEHCGALHDQGLRDPSRDPARAARRHHDRARRARRPLPAPLPARRPRGHLLHAVRRTPEATAQQIRTRRCRCVACSCVWRRGGHRPVPADERAFLDAVYHPAYGKAGPRRRLPAELAGDPDEVDVLAALVVRGPFGSFLRRATAEEVAAGEAAEDEYVVDLADYLDHDVHARAAQRPAARRSSTTPTGLRTRDRAATRRPRRVARAPGVGRRPQRGHDELPPQPRPAQRGAHRRASPTINQLPAQHPVRRVLQHTFHTLLIGNRENFNAHFAGPLSFSVTLFSHAAAEVAAIATQRLRDLRLLGPRAGPAVRPARHDRDAVPLPLPRQRARAVAGEPRVRRDVRRAVLPRRRGGPRRPGARGTGPTSSTGCCPTRSRGRRGGLTRDWVARVCATVIHLSTVEHDILNNVVWDYSDVRPPGPDRRAGVRRAHGPAARARPDHHAVRDTWRPFNMLFTSHVEEMAPDAAGRQVMLDLARQPAGDPGPDGGPRARPVLAYPKNFNVSITN